MVQIQRVARGHLALKPNEKGQEMLWYAAEENKPDLLRVLGPMLENGTINVDEADVEGFTAAMIAANYGNVDFLDQFIDFNPNFEITCADGSSALLLAAFNGHDEVVDLLLMDVGVNFLQRLPNGMSALHIAVQQNHLSVVEVLIDAEEELRGQYLNDGKRFPGAVLKLSNSQGNTALHLACKLKRDKILRLMSSVSLVPVGNVNKAGDTELILCAKNGFLEGLRILRGEGVLPARKLRYGDVLNVDAKNAAGYTALDYAAENGNLDAADYLINNLGAEATQRARNIFAQEWQITPGELSDLGFYQLGRPGTANTDDNSLFSEDTGFISGDGN